jgi:hypothetical protein
MVKAPARGIFHCVTQSAYGGLGDAMKNKSTDKTLVISVDLLAGFRVKKG